MFRQSYRSPVLIPVLWTLVVVSWLECPAVAQDELSEITVTQHPVNQAVEPTDEQAKLASDSDLESTEVADAAQRMTDEREADKQKLRKSAMAGLLVLSLICIVFLVLIILVALWLRRLRMLTCQPLPEQHPNDQLWYLRKGKGLDSSDVAELTDSGSSHGES